MATGPPTTPASTNPGQVDTRLVRVARIIGRLNIGGPAIQAISLTRELEPLGYRTLLLRGSEAEREGSMDELAASIDVHPVLIPPLRRDPGWHDVPALRMLTRCLASERPDIVHTHAAKAGTLGRVASMLAGAPLLWRRRPVRVHTFHGHSLTGYFSPRVSAAYRTIERILARRTDRLIAVSEQVRDELIALGVAPAQKFVVIPLGFDLRRFLVTGPERDSSRRALRASLGISENATVVTLIARLVPIKRVDRFLRAVSLLTDVEEVHFLIVGDGELRAELQAGEAARVAIHRLTWAGFRSDIPAVCFASDIVVLCSDNEGTPVSLIEASAAGVPVISTRVGGAAKVVKHGETGLLVPPDDGTALADAVRTLVADPERRETMGSVGRAYASQSFTLERLVDDIDQLYRTLLCERAQRDRNRTARAA